MATKAPKTVTHNIRIDSDSSFELDIRGPNANLFYKNDKNITCLMADEWNDEIVRLLKEMIEKLESE